MCQYIRINVLQKAIFKAKNTGNSLKIALPFENILDMELTEAFEFQQFLQIRAVGIDDSFVMDEVWIKMSWYIIDTTNLTTCIVLFCIFCRCQCNIYVIEERVGSFTAKYTFIVSFWWRQWSYITDVFVSRSIWKLTAYRYSTITYHAYNYNYNR